MSSDKLMRLSFALKSPSKVIIEFGMDDGRLLKKLVEKDHDIKFDTNTKKSCILGLSLIGSSLRLQNHV